MRYQITIVYTIKLMGNTVEHEKTLYRTLARDTTLEEIERDCLRQLQDGYYEPRIVSVELTALAALVRKS